jgi:hypothetical protein
MSSDRIKFQVALQRKLWSVLGWLRRAQIGYGFQVASQIKIVVDPRLPSAAQTDSQLTLKVYESKL